jgi:uncharacterized membrane protein YesL
VIDGLRAVLRGLNSVRWNGYAYIWANLAFLGFSLPVVTLPAALSALFRVGHVSQTDPSEADLMLFWETFKENFWQATLWGVINALVGTVCLSNLIVYWDVDGTLIDGLRLAWLAATFLWLGTFIYTWSIFYEMEEPSLWGATRNALVMTITNPFFTLTILICLGIIAMVSAVLVASWVVLTFGVISAVANAAVLDRLALYRKTQKTNTP